jgi:hypothetical protein
MPTRPTIKPIAGLASAQTITTKLRDKINPKIKRNHFSRSLEGARSRTRARLREARLRIRLELFDFLALAFACISAGRIDVIAAATKCDDDYLESRWLTGLRPVWLVWRTQGDAFIVSRRVMYSDRKVRI